MTAEARLRGIVREIIASYFKMSDAEAEVSLISAPKMRALNRAFRGLDRATNVLSFETPKNFPVAPGAPRMLGEVYLCPSYIKAKGEDLDYLAVHGLLHLTGFSHEKNRDRIRMKSTEQKIFRWLKNRF